MQAGLTPPPTGTPAPTPTPTPAGTAVVILPQPAVGQFASTGVWTNLYKPMVSAAGRFEFVDHKQGDQPLIRYTGSGTYEVMLPGEDFGPLSHDPKIANPTPNDPFLVIHDCCGVRAFNIEHSNSGFSYSAMATWARPDLDFGFTTDAGVVAFGPGTPAGKVPLTGTASYAGFVSGLSDAKQFDEAGQGWYLLPVGGTVQLNFDFAKSTLAGQLDLSIAGGMNPVPVGTYSFAQTMFSPGSTTYSGSFATPLSGLNYFNGIFTGPNAEETIGSWAVPFQLNGEDHQALGAWIAKSH